MKFGVNTFIWAVDFDRSMLPLLSRIKEHGFDGLQVPLFRPADFIGAELRQAAAAAELELTVCPILVDGLSLISDDAAIRAKTRRHLLDVIRLAADAGSDTIAGPIYCPVGYLPGRRRNADEWKRAVEGYQSITEALVANNVTLAIEPINRFETYFLNTAADAAKLCDEVAHPNVGILYDTFHANIEEKNIADGLRLLGRHVKHIHASENDRGTPGSGHVDWPAIFQALREIGYDGWLTIESFGPGLGAFSSAVCIWRDIEKTPESIAFEGIKYLKQAAAAALKTSSTNP